MLAAAAVAGACGTAVTPPPGSPPPTVSPSASASASPSPSLVPLVDHAVVYFARDRLPPVAAHVAGAGDGASAEQRILSRVRRLFATDATRPLFNIARSSQAVPASVRVDGDLASVDFRVAAGDWGVAGSAGTRAFVQQLVYTITEEPGIRRALVTENGHMAIIGGEGLVIDHPVTREDVSGYVRASRDPMTWRADGATPVRVTSRLFLDEIAPAMSRFVIDTGLWGGKATLGFNTAVMTTDERAFPDMGKWTFAISVSGATTADDPMRVVDRTPVRAVKAIANGTSVRYEIGLDDLRPWRVAMLYEPLRLVVDIGGDPEAVSPNIALYRPAFGTTVSSGDEVSGLIRAFEAQFEYRIRDASGKETVGYARGSLGTAEMWGTFSVALPELPRGAATIEIVLRSPKDGSVSESVFTSIDVGP